MGILAMTSTPAKERQKADPKILQVREGSAAPRIYVHTKVLTYKYSPASWSRTSVFTPRMEPQLPISHSAVGRGEKGERKPTLGQTSWHRHMRE